jgi:MFS family permease
MESNIRLYPWFRMASDVQAWIPVFFLYFSAYVSLEQVIQLSSIYYLSVFILEVPSGYFSDRIGRRTTLMISALCMITASLFFLAGSGFTMFALGQVMLAAGIAFQSGTDTALHYDSLAQLGLESEYESREARAEKLGLGSLALACLLGGVPMCLDGAFARIQIATRVARLLALVSHCPS